MPDGFMLGAATAAHQVEGDNVHSDFWVMEQLPNSTFIEPSGNAVEHYKRFREDILLLRNVGLNAYRFSIEWARIEPKQGVFDLREVDHYREVLRFCRENGVEPIVTLHHFTSPKWLVSQGGWESEQTITYFADYCSFIVKQLGEYMSYVCTINEANMGLQLASIMKRYMRQAAESLQVGMNFGSSDKMRAAMREAADAFNINEPSAVHTFLSQRTPEGDLLIIRAHKAARKAIKALYPHIKVGLTLSLHDIQVIPGGEEVGAKEWEQEFLHYLPFIRDDDFIGVQNYTREVFGADGVQPVPSENEITQMGYEFYPQALENVIKKVAEEFKGEILVTENGIGTNDDNRRIAFIREAIDGVKKCISSGIPVKGYLHWTLLDNFEWHKGFGMTFGLVSVNRKTYQRVPKASLAYLGSLLQESEGKHTPK